jgi:hypothetical protein
VGKTVGAGALELLPADGCLWIKARSAIRLSSRGRLLKVTDTARRAKVPKFRQAAPKGGAMQRLVSGALPYPVLDALGFWALSETRSSRADRLLMAAFGGPSCLPYRHPRS